MPRGKHNLNQNRGVHLTAHKKVAVQNMECNYGHGCTRPDCIYMHSNGREIDKLKDTKQGVDNSIETQCQSKQPCMAFLAGQCKFTDAGCRKYHPTDPEQIKRLVLKYKMTKCQFEDGCRTKGCLYSHPNDENSCTIVDESATYAPSRMSFGGSIFFSQESQQQQYHYDPQIQMPPSYHYSQHQGEYQFKGAGSQPLPHQQRYNVQSPRYAHPQPDSYAQFDEHATNNNYQFEDYQDDKSSKIFTNDDFPALG